MKKQSKWQIEGFYEVKQVTIAKDYYRLGVLESMDTSNKMCTIIHIILSYDAFVTFHYVFDSSYGIVDPSNIKHTSMHTFYIYIYSTK